MEGGKGTGRECASLPCPGRIFCPPPYFLSPAAAAAGAGVGVLAAGALVLVEDDEESLEDEPPSFLVEL